MMCSIKERIKKYLSEKFVNRIKILLSKNDVTLYSCLNCYPTIKMLKYKMVILRLHIDFLNFSNFVGCKS